MPLCSRRFAGRAAVKPKSAVKSTEWSARTSGAPPAVGKKPASASQTKNTIKEMNGWMNGWMDECWKRLYWKDIIQGPGAIKKNRCSFLTLVFTLKPASFLSSQNTNGVFLHLCTLILNTQVCDGASCWLTLNMWCAKPPILLCPKVVVISSEPHFVRLLLGCFLYFTLTLSGYIIQW